MPKDSEDNIIMIQRKESVMFTEFTLFESGKKNPEAIAISNGMSLTVYVRKITVEFQEKIFRKIRNIFKKLIFYFKMYLK
jgi:hypothetical protein